MPRYRSPIPGLVLRVFPLAILPLVLVSPAASQVPRTEPVVGLRERTPAVHALAKARIVVGPGRVIEQGTVVVRDGVLVAVGAEVVVPRDAKVWDLSGKTIYPGLIDAVGDVSVEGNPPGPRHWSGLVTPQSGVADRYQADSGLNEKLRAQGVTARLLAPATGVFKGISCLALTGDDPPSRSILKRDVAQHLRLTVPRGRGREFPNSPMGAVALARQTMLDAQWYRQAWNAYRADRTLPRPEQNVAYEALQPLLEGQLLIIDSSNELYFLRADAFAREFSLNAVIRGSGREYRRLDAIRATGRTVLLPVNFPRPPGVGTAEAALNASFEDLMHWDHAPENPARLEKAGVRFALTTAGLSDPAKFLSALRTAVKRGLPADAALRALTSVPAELFGVADRLGSVEVGKVANLVVVDGPDLFDEKSSITETWVDGLRYEIAKEPSVEIRGKWAATIDLAQDQSLQLEFQLTGKPLAPTGTVRRAPADPAPANPAAKANAEEKTEAKVSAEKKPEPAETKLEQIVVRDGRFSCTFDGKSLLVSPPEGATPSTGESPGKIQMTVVVSVPGEGQPTWLGNALLPDGRRVDVRATRTEGPSATDPKPESKPADAKAGNAEEKPPTEPAKIAGASFPVHFPLGAFGRASAPEQPPLVALVNGSIWTSGAAGIIERGTVLVRAGRIVAVGVDIPIPNEAVKIDLAGRHLSPGIIDCHSHMATDGGVNEASQSVTAEVRISDFIDCNDIDIYRQLAGGVTTANILHGSANTIGGQNQVIKLRWGALPNEMKMTEAPPGIKFALGENVKQSYLAESTRYPQSRMGVEQILLDEFTAAREYRDRWRDWEQNRTGLPPRRDLELDAIVEVLERKRWIHCHSYRQDEILAFLRVLEGHGVQVGTLQHILEGYKVADAMARHGAMGSSFSDWWAYKFEVLDAIPYNGALMHQAGVVVSFNSDDRELARHLNHEAAKAVKYGGVPPVEALKFVTLNPARQLRIDRYVGSIEVGKQADLVVWSGSPLSTLSRCEQTWIDGRRYFDRGEDLELRQALRRMKMALIQKVIGSGESMRSPDDAGVNFEELWPREDEVCHPHRLY